MSKWKCEICNSEFDNYQAQGFNGIIYCPLCYFKELYKREKQEKEDYKSRCEKAIPMLKELNECIKDILNIGIDIKNISDIENILQNGSDSQ